MFKPKMQYFVKTICLIMLVLNYFPTEDLSIWWNVASLIISLIFYMTCTYRFTSLSLLTTLPWKFVEFPESSTKKEKTSSKHNNKNGLTLNMWRREEIRAYMSVCACTGAHVCLWVRACVHACVH